MRVRDIVSSLFSSPQHTIITFWLFAFCMHVSLIQFYVFVPVSGNLIVETKDLPNVFFFLINSFLAPFVSILTFSVFAISPSGSKRHTRVTLGTLIMTAFANISFLAYVAAPFAFPTSGPYSLVDLYSNATMFFGMINIILGHFTSLVFSSSDGGL